MASGPIVPFEQRVNTVRELLEKHRDSIGAALPKHVTAERMLRIALTCCERTPKLLEADPRSLLGAVMTCAQLGLEPDSITGQSYLVPFFDSKKNVLMVQVIVGYKGLREMIARSGQVSTVEARVVRKSDKFRFVAGTPTRVKHEPDVNAVPQEGAPPPDVQCVYATARLRDGGYQADMMTVGEVEAIRKRSKAANSGPWVTDWTEMAKKTVLRRIAKVLPMSVEANRAVALDEMAERDIPQDLDIEADAIAARPAEAKVVVPPAAPPKPPEAPAKATEDAEPAAAEETPPAPPAKPPQKPAATPARAPAPKPAKAPVAAKAAAPSEPPESGEEPPEAEF